MNYMGTTPFILIISIIPAVLGQVLTPPYFNLAVTKVIEATATCGYDEKGQWTKELYCRLTGGAELSETEDLYHVDYGVASSSYLGYDATQKQFCDFCNPQDPGQDHRVEHAVDGTQSWWQSPPLSRGLDYNQVNLTINLGQEFHIGYVFIKMANSPRPGVWALERSTDYGQTWKAWQYFADSESDCHTFFGDSYEKEITRDDSVICTTKYSKIMPLVNGEIVVSLVNGRPSALNFTHSTTLQEWTRATNVQLTLLRTKTLLGHLMGVARQDPTVTRRYYYSIKDISLGGRCVCNGHADVCDRTDPANPIMLLCRCQHNTCGPQCDVCCDGFVQKPWRPATIHSINQCEPCNCHGHSRECVYVEDVDRKKESLDIHGNYEGGGVCQNCLHNTEGINCEKCRHGYYRPSRTPPDDIYACVPCQCDLAFTTGSCEDGTGNCICRTEFAGPKCDRCNAGYYGFPLCIPCDCNVNGTSGGVCIPADGLQCPCKPHYSGNHCDDCVFGYYGFPDCKFCACDYIGSHSPWSCAALDGQCSCHGNFGGRECSQCADGYFGYPQCAACDCLPMTSTSEICDKGSGVCLCQPGYGGPRCDQCVDGYYGYPNCTECRCTVDGSSGGTCDREGRCICKANYGGRTCDTCMHGYHKYPECLSCGCDEQGAWRDWCDQQTGQCDCKPTFTSTKCDQCKQNYYNYPICEKCSCNPAGAVEVPGHPLGGCGVTGQLCQCKERVHGHNCELCKRGYRNLNINNPLGCEDCGCYLPGTVGGLRDCDASTGQCVCKSYTTTTRCDTCLNGTYNLQGHNVHGCQDCDCMVGASTSKTCDKHSGQCSCRPRIYGRTCDKPLANHYFASLHQHQYEMEDGHTRQGGPVRYGFNLTIFPTHSWKGYTIFSTTQDEVMVDVYIKDASLYRLIFRYVNPGVDGVVVEVTVTPEAPTDVQQTSLVTLHASHAPRFITVSGSTFVLNPGMWTVSLKTQEKLYVDYLVLLPQAYYEASLLERHILQPCTVPLTQDICRHFEYSDLSQFVKAEASMGYTAVTNFGRTQLYQDTRVLNELNIKDMAYLDVLQPNLIITQAIPDGGEHMLIVTYHSTVSGTQNLTIDVTTRLGDVIGIVLLPACPYSSLCHQAVQDGSGTIKVFDMEVYTSFTLQGEEHVEVAIEGIIAIPRESWDISLITPTFRCIHKNMKCLEGYLSGVVADDAEVENDKPQSLQTTDIDGYVNDAVWRAMQEQPVEESEVFITRCAQNHFYIQPTERGFCRESVYSLSTEYNNGVLSCDCHKQGSYSFGCEELGGQCPCRPHVIGRTCSRCRTGYYGFPNCKPCSCPSGLCDPDNGQCVCPPRVTGDNCDVCLPRTFGFDPLIGCDECNCDITGVQNYDINCDVTTGQCSCKPNVGGRRCDRCLAGYYRFPSCLPCSCDSRGTTEDVCDQNTAQCLCKDNTEGPQCAQCKQNTFYLEERNPLGCAACFCFGASQQCQSSTYRRTPIRHMLGWKVSGHYQPSLTVRFRTLEVMISEDTVIEPKTGLYLIAPEDYLGNKVTSYGGKLLYTILSQPSAAYPSQPLTLAYVKMQGHNFTIVHHSAAKPTLGVAFNMELDLLETQFVHELSGNDVTREQMLVILSNLQNLQLLASFYTNISSVVLIDVQLDVASPTGTGSIARNVEQCKCPPHHAGTSCEDCEKGYYHSEQLKGTCIPCQCNGRATTCDQQTGHCIDCAGHYGGAQCESCEVGYYQDPATAECTVCSCPLPIPVNNFAESCEVEKGVMKQCHCHPGYTGPTCNVCDLGYYGDPTDLGGSCSLCGCSGNIDPTDRRSCDPYTGACLLCLNDTRGSFCQLCDHWFYGDAVYRKDCQPCECDRSGSELCDDDTGACLCKPGVIGPRCDSCAAGTYGLDRGVGCDPCDCDLVGARDSHCDVVSGQCLCRPGAGGRRCDTCQQGYWNFGPAGCHKCQCGSGGGTTCDVTTGQCHCQPGVTGPLCDQCLPRYLQLANHTCAECGSCIHLLLDDLDLIQDNITVLLDDLDHISVGIDAINRLTYINDTAQQLGEELFNISTGSSYNDTELNPIIEDIIQIEKTLDHLHDKALLSGRIAELTELDTEDIKLDVEDLTDPVQEAIKQAQDGVNLAKDVLNLILNNIQDQNVDKLIEQASDILDRINLRNFLPNRRRAGRELRNAQGILRKAKELDERGDEEIADILQGLPGRVQNITGRLKDLIKPAQLAINTAQAAMSSNAPNKPILVTMEDENKQIKRKKREMMKKIENSTNIIEKANTTLEDTLERIKEIEAELSRLDSAFNKIEDASEAIEKSNDDLRPLVENATNHAFNLVTTAENVEKLYADTKDSADGALEASRAYQSIVDTINDAANYTREASMSAEFAHGKAVEVQDKPADAKEKSRNLKNTAKRVRKVVNKELRSRLKDAKLSVDELDSTNQQIEDILVDAKDGLSKLPPLDPDRAKDAVSRAADAETRASQVNDKVDAILDGLLQGNATTLEIKDNITSAGEDILYAERSIKGAKESISELLMQLDKLTERMKDMEQDHKDMNSNLARLKDSIATTRGEANRIVIGVNMTSSTSVQVHNPPNLAEAGTYTRLSLNFRTQEDNGLLVYIGPDGGARHNPDFMALQVMNGKVTLTFDLGDGEEKINSDLDVSDNKKHTVVIERMGNFAKLSVKTLNSADSVAEGRTKGSHSVFDLDPYSTKFYVGGIPDKAQISTSLINHHFVGCIEDVTFNGEEVGLWHFDHSENMQGCVLSDVFSESTGFHFDGGGGLVNDKGLFNPRSSSQISLSFLTYASKGLLYLLHGEEDFMSLEMQDGKLLFQYDLGTGYTRLISNNTYNDGRWHKVFTSRRKQSGSLRVDDIEVFHNKSTGTAKYFDMDLNTDMNFGGYFYGQHNYKKYVTNEGFLGCIKDVKPGNLNDYVKAKGIRPGCPQVIVAVASFPASGMAYTELDPVVVGADFTANLRLKSTEQDGLIFYLADDAQENAISLALLNGKLVLVGTSGGNQNQVETNRDIYANGNWHSLTISKINREIQLGVDDEESMKAKMSGKRRMATTSPLYLGGVDASYILTPPNVATTTHFTGCLGDVIINNQRVNFAMVPASNMKDVDLSKCFLSNISTTTTGASWTQPPMTIPTLPHADKMTSPEVTTVLMSSPEVTTKTTPTEATTETTDLGVEFGISKNSHIQIDASKQKMKKMVNMSLEFMTAAEDGVIFYIYGLTSADWMGVYMKGGKITFAYDLGTGPARITSKEKFNDGQWHTLSFWRKNRQGILEVDESKMGEKKSKGTERTLNVDTPFYIGGLPADVTTKASSHLKGITESLRGCVRSWQSEGSDLGEPSLRVDVQPCTGKPQTISKPRPTREPGAYFYQDGFVQLKDKFKVGHIREISLNIKPQTREGIILAVSSASEEFYLILQLVSSKLVFNVDNGDGNVQVEDSTDLWDGDWHHIQANKIRNVLQLAVDDGSPSSASGKSGRSADTDGPLFIGGVSDYHQGIKTTGLFEGCIQNVTLDGVMQDLATGKVTAPVNLVQCPLND